MLFMSAMKSCDSLLKLLIFCVWLKSLFLFVVLELLDQPLDSVLAYCILRLDCRKSCSRFSVIHGVVTSFPVTFSNRSMVPKMILRRGFVDLVDHVASSFLARLVAFSELSVPSGRARP